MMSSWDTDAATSYVWKDSPNPTPPYSSWETAAHVIQDGVDAAINGDTVLVTNGVYSTGGKASDPYTDWTISRVVVGKAITLRSVNGPEVTIIEGYQQPTTTFGDSAIRCVYLMSGTTLSGFTLTNGATREDFDAPIASAYGGGVHCIARDAVVTNCILAGNSAHRLGGGVYGGTLIDCVLTGNSVPFGAGGGAARSSLTNCVLVGNKIGADGGGAYQSELQNCVLKGNEAGTWGGGAADSELQNCVVASNYAGYGPGGAWGTLNNCTVIGNSASAAVGGVSGWLTNCIVYYNSAPSHPNYWPGDVLAYTCTYPMPTNGIGNITNAPLFVDTYNWADLRLRPDSPCIDEGNNDFVTWETDLDGNPRILNGIVDMGAYEFKPLSPAELVLHLAEIVAKSDLSHKRPLLASLEAALASIKRGSHYSTMGQLGAFQNKVAAQIYRHDPEFALELMEGAQQVMDALNDNP